MNEKVNLTKAAFLARRVSECSEKLQHDVMRVEAASRDGFADETMLKLASRELEAVVSYALMLVDEFKEGEEE